MSKQSMQIAINRLESLKSQTATGSDEEAYYQTIIDRYAELMAA